MNILVLNCGSSSVKFQLIATDLDLIAQNADRRLSRGTIERIGGEAIVTLQVEGGQQQRSTAQLRDIRATVEFIATWASPKEIRNSRNQEYFRYSGNRPSHGAPNGARRVS